VNMILFAMNHPPAGLVPLSGLSAGFIKALPDEIIQPVFVELQADGHGFQDNELRRRHRRAGIDGGGFAAERPAQLVLGGPGVNKAGSFAQ
jgi:hypothetical protein